MNLLGIDYGQKNIGLAWTDTALGVVLPFGVVKNLSEVATVITQEKIDKIIVGLPIGLDGKENEHTKKVRAKFLANSSILKVPIIFFDERFTSQAADRKSGGVSRDEVSAMIILENWLETQK